MSYASITIPRRIEWIDTDARGIYHWVTVVRYVEAAEALLHDRLGIRGRTFGRTPRVHFTVDFHRELRFFDEVLVTLAVSAVGRTSVRYRFDLTHDDAVVADGEYVTVYVGETDGHEPSPWPDDIRSLLMSNDKEQR